MKKITVILFALLLASVNLTAGTERDIFKSRLDAYMKGLREKNYSAMADVMHPDTLAKLKVMFVEIIKMDQSGTIVKSFFDVNSAEEVSRMSEKDVFIKLMKNVMNRLDGNGMDLSSVKAEYVGEYVDAASAKGYIIYKVIYSVNSTEMEKLGVIQLRKSGDLWCFDLDGEFKGLYESMKSGLSQ